MAWRPLPGAPSPPVRLGDTIDRVLTRLGSPPGAGVEAVFERWSEVVGEAMAARTRPVAIDGETLVVACDEPALTTHVRFLEPQLVERLAELAGARHVSRVEVRVDRRGRGPRPPRRPKSQR
jgi:predicted nucleic acid-binding Zn ribbon protein